MIEKSKIDVELAIKVNNATPNRLLDLSPISMPLTQLCRARFSILYIVVTEVRDLSSTQTCSDPMIGTGICFVAFMMMTQLLSLHDIRLKATLRVQVWMRTTNPFL